MTIHALDCCKEVDKSRELKGEKMTQDGGISNAQWGAFQCQSADFPIAFRRIPVVHCAVYVRPLGSVRMSTGQWTCVHFQVDDDKSAIWDWKMYG